MEFFDPAHTEFEPVEDAIMYRSNVLSSTAAPAGPIVVMTWNIKFGGARIDFFFDCYGNRVLMSESEVISNMRGLASKINEINPDIVLLQEADVEAKRSAYVDEVQWLLNHTSLNYGAYASQWKADYIPSDGLGRMNSGNAILSRWPLKNAKRYALPIIGEQDRLTQYFYLRRNYIRATVNIAGYNGFYVFNIHTSAYSKDATKKTQLDIFLKALVEANQANRSFLAGGDFNEIPPGSDQLNGFDDAACTHPEYIADDYSAETTWLDEFYTQFTPAVAFTDYLPNNQAYFTHTVKKTGFWNRKIDYIFTNTSFVAGSTVTYQDSSTGIATMPLSDHAPISTQWSVP